MSLAPYKPKSNYYLRSLLDPQNIKADLPDDILRLHTTRTETVTYNLTVPSSGAGIVVLWPNNPSLYIGAHYTFNSTSGKYNFDQYLLTAQNLPNSYDYGRKVSQLVTIRSSTLPAGVYALNGTFNAVRFEGTLSEIPNLSYSSIMSATTNTLDKKGNILVGTGVASLTLPQGFDIPYVRLGDASPSATVTKTTIYDGGRSLKYIEEIPSGSATGATVQIFQTVVNCDALDGVNMTMSGSISSNHSGYYSVNYYLLALDGSIITQLTLKQSADDVVSNSQNSLYGMGATFSRDDITQPVAAVWTTLEFTSEAAPATLTYTAIKVTADVVNGAAVGYQSPTTVVPYQGVAAGSVITVAGVSNFELIPNPELQQNLEMTYGRFDPTDLTYVKLLLANREHLALRSVMDISDYNQLLTKIGMYTEYGNVEAESFDFGELLRKLKAIAVPALSAIFPQFSPIIGAVDQFANDLIGSSASGAPVSYASASGSPITMQSRALNRTRRLHAFSADEPLNRPDIDLMLGDRFSNMPEQALVDVSDAGMALFPVIMMYNDLPVQADSTHMYVALQLTDKIKRDYPGYINMPHYSIGKSTVYNAVRPSSIEGEPSKGFLRGDYILLPLYQYSDGSLMTERSPVPVSGRSHQLALFVSQFMANKGRQGLLPSALFTGSISGTGINRVYGISLKRALAASHNMPLFGNSPGTTRVRDVGTLEKLAIGSAGLLNRPVSDLPPKGTLAVSATSEDVDVREDMEGTPFEENYELEEDTAPQMPIPAPAPAPRLSQAISRQVATDFLEQGEEPPSMAEKIDAIMEFLTRSPLAFESLYYLIVHNYEKSLTNAMVGMYNNIVTQPPSKSTISPEEKSARIMKSGRLITPEEIKRAGGIVTEQMIKAAPLSSSKGKSEGKMIASLTNMYNNNSTLYHSGRALEDFVNSFVRLKLVPTPSQALAWINGVDPTTVPQNQGKVVRKDYETYIRMLGPNPSQDSVMRVKAMVDEIYEQRGGRGPDSLTNQSLVMRIKHDILNKASAAMKKGLMVPAPQAQAPIRTVQQTNPNTGAIPKRVPNSTLRENLKKYRSLAATE